MEYIYLASIKKDITTIRALITFGLAFSK